MLESVHNVGFPAAPIKNQVDLALYLSESVFDILDAGCNSVTLNGAVIIFPDSLLNSFGPVDLAPRLIAAAPIWSQLFVSLSYTEKTA